MWGYPMSSLSRLVISIPVASSDGKYYGRYPNGKLTALWPDPLPNGEVGVPYSYTLTAEGGTPPYSFAVSSGALPSGLSLNGATGVISGTPTTPQSMDAVTFSVTDSA